MVKQLQVALEDRPGNLCRLLAALALEGVDVKALEVHDRVARGPGPGEAARGEANLLVSDLSRATRALDAEGFAWEVTDALALIVPDRPGGLAEVLRHLAEAGVNVRHLFASVSRVAGQSLSVLTVDDAPRAEQLLRAAGIPVIADLEVSPPDPVTGGGVTLADHLGIDFMW